MQKCSHAQTRCSTNVDMDDVMHDWRLNNDAAQFHVSTKVDVIRPLNAYVNRLHTPHKINYPTQLTLNIALTEHRIQKELNHLQ